jgi:hypothetical protein
MEELAKLSELSHFFAFLFLQAAARVLLTGDSELLLDTGDLLLLLTGQAPEDELEEFEELEKLYFPQVIHL